MEREIEYYVVCDPFRGRSCLAKNVYDQDGNTTHHIDILFRGKGNEDIGRLEKLAVELAQSDPGSSAWSDFDVDGMFIVHARKIWPEEN